MRLDDAFYRRTRVTTVARGLIGKHLFARIDGQLCGGIVVETEAYAGPEDRASHAFGNRRTSRTEPMFLAGGAAYVFLCYGMHHCFNVVTGAAGIPHAVLIRALQPTHGLAAMRCRRGPRVPDARLTRGPGALAQALGITVADSGLALAGRRIWLEARGPAVPARRIAARRRIGVDYAGEDAERPWRFVLRDSPWLSRPA